MNSVDKLKHIALVEGQNAAKRSGQNPGKAQPDELFLLAELTNAESEYTISIDQDDQKSIWKGAKGLAHRNGFKATAMAVGILPVLVNNGKVYFGAQAPSYFPDRNVFSAAATNVLTEAQALEGIYMGDVTIQTNEGIRIDEHKLLNWRTVQQTQESLQYTTDGTNDGSHVTSAIQDGSEFKTLGGVMTFMGGDDNYIKIRIRCQDKTDIAGTATRKNYLIIRLLGSNVKGQTTAKTQN